MTIRGHIRNGQVVPDEPAQLPEGAKVRIEVVSTAAKPRPPRQGGQYAGRIQLAPDFDEWPQEMCMSRGMEE